MAYFKMKIRLLYREVEIAKLLGDKDFKNTTRASKGVKLWKSSPIPVTGIVFEKVHMKIDHNNEKDGGCSFYQNALRSEIV